MIVHTVGAATLDAGACASCGAYWRPGDPIVTHRIVDGLSAFKRACAKCAPSVAARARQQRTRRKRRANGNV
jgi:hypothetical protein